MKKIKHFIQGTDYLSTLKTAARFQPAQVTPVLMKPELVYGSSYQTSLTFLERVALFQTECSHQGVGKSSTTLYLPTDYTLNDLFLHLNELTTKQMRKKLRIKLPNSEALDISGVLRGVMTFVARQIEEGQCNILQKTDNEQYYFNPTQNNPSHMRAFGRLIGVCLARVEDKVNIPINISLSIFKIILGQALDFSDIELVFPTISESFVKLLALDPELIEDLTMSFTVGADNRELITNGNNVLVTRYNRRTYVEYLIKYYLGKHLPLKEFVLGIQDACPRELLCIFSTVLLQILVCGEQHIDLGHLQAITILKLPATETEWFWKFVKSLSQTQLQLFLAFVTGSSVLPVASNTFRITVQKVKSASTNSLPISHTCFNSLDLPAYTSYEEFERKMLLAIEWTSAKDYGLV